MDAGQRALLSLTGLSVGDALGERFFGPPGEVVARIEARELPPGPWRWTDDTQMALSVVEQLLASGTIDQDQLARRFARRYEQNRGYGGGAQGLLQSFKYGAPWSEAAPAMFDGQGSYGNGGAMRVAPLGAYFANDLDRLVGEARWSAEVTHAHPEAIAGAIAVAVAAAWAWRLRAKPDVEAVQFLGSVLELTPSGETKARLERAGHIPGNTHPRRVAEELGSGQEVAAHDTVPFALWCAAHRLGDYSEAFWATVKGLGDRDTTCAIVGGIVALSSGAVPGSWIEQREPLSADFLFEQTK